MVSQVEQYDADIIVVGAGMAGSIAAYLLGKQGFSVILLDRQKESPPVFRAEKLEPDQSVLLRKFGLLDARRPQAEPIGKILRYDDDEVSDFDTIEQYGIRYHDTVNQIREIATNYCDFHVARVKDIKTDSQRQSVTLQNDQVLTAKLVILSCGYRGGLLTKLNFVMSEEQRLCSLSFGFDIEPTGEEAFSFNGFNYHIETQRNGIDYITIFKIGDIMRANVFTQLAPRDARVKTFVSNPYDALIEFFPKLFDYTGQFRITSKVESFVTQYYRLKSYNYDGVVLLGDAYQSVSPTTGTGLSKVFNDVDVLCNECIPEWLKTEGMGKDKIKRFYNHAQKQNSDKHSQDVWRYYWKRFNGEGKFKRLLNTLRILPVARMVRKLLS